ncbi:MAG: FtsL-like putative cell division protein [Bacteroidota bacterium]
MTQQKEARREWRRLFNYQWIVKNIPYFLFLSVLAVIYIYNGHYSDNTVKDINKTSKELKELQYEYKSKKSEVMFRSKQSELAKAVAPLGLMELEAPPMILKDSARLTGAREAN